MQVLEVVKFSHVLKQELDRWERSRRKLEVIYGSACYIRKSGALSVHGVLVSLQGLQRAGSRHLVQSNQVLCSTSYCPAASNCVLCPRVLVKIALQLGWAGDVGAAQLGSVISAHSAHTVACSQVMALWKEFFLGLFISTCLPLFNTLKWMWQSSFGYTFDEILKWQPWIL